MASSVKLAGREKFGVSCTLDEFKTLKKGDKVQIKGEVFRLDVRRSVIVSAFLVEKGRQFFSDGRVMANTRALVKRRKAIRNIRKITRTMELIATARFKKAMDRAIEAEALHAQDRRAGRRPERHGGQHHASAAAEARGGQEQPAAGPLLQPRPVRRLQRQHPPRGQRRHPPAAGQDDRRCTWSCPASGPSPIFRFQGIPAEQTYTHFEDKPRFDEVEELANRYIARLHRRQDRPRARWPT